MITEISEKGQFAEPWRHVFVTWPKRGQSPMRRYNILCPKYSLTHFLPPALSTCFRSCWAWCTEIPATARSFWCCMIHNISASLILPSWVFLPQLPILQWFLKKTDFNESDPFSNGVWRQSFSWAFACNFVKFYESFTDHIPLQCGLAQAVLLMFVRTNSN